jgi:tetratricopeptide (TPR) repeat protein
LTVRWRSTILFDLILLSAAVALAGCAVTMRERQNPISNPFYEYHGGVNGDSGQNIILRTKKGDRSVEVELPGDAQSMSDFVLPVSPAFKDAARAPAAEEGAIDDTYKGHAATLSDREITSNFPHGSAEDDARRQDIEKGLNLLPSDDTNSTEGSPSYLANTDRIKQLYKSSRYEAALLEIDGMLHQYQTDPKLYEMRGTLLDRLGRRELALKSWNQALRLNPKNQTLKKFIERKELRASGGFQ